ncbi:MAG: hypothetical protein IIC04_07360 [Proteobacteria bacterium]|nr:hypothetical protein [Pseudomonadota bacterium]
MLLKKLGEAFAAFFAASAESAGITANARAAAAKPRPNRQRSRFLLPVFEDLSIPI